MGRYGSFYVWTFITALLFTGMYWLYESGFALSIWEADITHLTQVIAILALIGNFRIGYLTFRFGKLWNKLHIGSQLNLKLYDIKQMRKNIDEWWFVSTIFMYIGILGTSIGAYYMGKANFAVFAQAHGGHFTSEQAFDLLAKVYPAVSTVFSVTGAGVFATILLMVQLFLFTSLSGIEDHHYEK